MEAVAEAYEGFGANGDGGCGWGSTVNGCGGAADVVGGGCSQGCGGGCVWCEMDVMLLIVTDWCSS